MNIFVLDSDVNKSVEYLCDKHVVKMVLETAQLLCSPFDPGTAPYKRTHYNHPCSVWARESAENYQWLVDYGYAISREYSRRYLKFHKSEATIDWCSKNSNLLSLPNTGLTNFALAMPEHYKTDCAVESYRNYYKGDKAYMATWKHTEEPYWWK